jgi:hypothetical protein
MIAIRRIPYVCSNGRSELNPKGSLGVGNAQHMRTVYEGNAGDMGEGLSSKLLILAFGVGGVTPVAETLPMNQD